MDLFELFENDRDEERGDRRDGRRPEGAAPERGGGVRGFFRRWMAAVREDEDDDYDRRSRTGRRESGFELD